VVLVGAGLPQLRARTGKAKSYAERLFEFPSVDSLAADDARLALARPAAAEGVDFEPEALDRIVEQTAGYPYFLQEWGKHAWDVAGQSPITLDDVEQATTVTIASLDESFFRVRFDRLTPAEKRYLRAMAELGAGPHRSGDVAKVLGREVNEVGIFKANLIHKGMVWSPSHGDTAFTVPLFDPFLRRVMPGDDWRES
ncbi:MAG: ATP-binding protein, partial [Planctomycetota bacterium]